MSDYEKAIRLKNVMLRALGHWRGEFVKLKPYEQGRSYDFDAEYRDLRTGFMAAQRTRELLPGIVRECRTFDECRHYATSNWVFTGQAEEEIHSQFSAFLEYVEVANLTQTTDGENGMDSTADKGKVFVVHGRNLEARDEVFSFLRAVGLQPLEWGEVVKATGHGSPYIGDVLEKGFEIAQAVVVLMTPDDEARLREPYRSTHDGTDETDFTPQPRQNVLLEAGMALGSHGPRTIIVEFGNMRAISDLVGRHVLRLNNSAEQRTEFVSRLDTAGCDVDTTGKTDWLRQGDFDSVLKNIRAIEPSPPTETPAETSPTDSLLSDEERTYLMDIGRPRNETAYSIDYMDSLVGDEVRFIEMMERFVALGLARIGSDFYILTTKGRKKADELWQFRILRAIVEIVDTDKYVTENDVANEAVLDDGKAEHEVLCRHLKTLEELRCIDRYAHNIVLTDKGREYADLLSVNFKTP